MEIKPKKPKTETSHKQNRQDKNINKNLKNKHKRSTNDKKRDAECSEIY